MLIRVQPENERSDEVEDDFSRVPRSEARIDCRIIKNNARVNSSAKSIESATHKTKQLTKEIV